MPSNSFGEIFRVTTFGESHGVAVGVVIDGVVPGMVLDLEGIGRDLERRRPGQSPMASARAEPDRLEVLSGLCDGVTNGAPLCLVVRNRDARSEDYGDLAQTFRPGHGDYTWWRKTGVRDWRGGGRLSGRETVARVMAGAVAKQMLVPLGVRIVGHTLEAAGVRAQCFHPEAIENNAMRCADAEAGGRMERAIEEMRARGDSAGGVVEVRAWGVPAGLGEPVFDKLEARLGAAFLSLGAVKGVEVGAGFAVAGMRGSESNDPLTPEGFGSNHGGGILGGISSGQTIVVRLAVKAPSSIALPQDSVTLEGEATKVTVKGRHDPCICPRLVPVAEAMAALVLVDAWMRQRALAVPTWAPSSDGLDGLRHGIDLVDREIIQALGRRMALARRIGALKRDRGQEVVDHAREAAIREAHSRQALEAGVDRELVEELFALIIRRSREVQRPESL